jgi:hypothetical protein
MTVPSVPDSGLGITSPLVKGSTSTWYTTAGAVLDSPRIPPIKEFPQPKTERAAKITGKMHNLLKIIVNLNKSTEAIFKSNR